MAVHHLQRSASSELPVKLAAFVQQFVYRTDRGQDSVLLAAHPANRGETWRAIAGLVQVDWRHRWRFPSRRRWRDFAASDTKLVRP